MGAFTKFEQHERHSTWHIHTEARRDMAVQQAPRTDREKVRLKKLWKRPANETTRIPAPQRAPRHPQNPSTGYPSPLRNKRRAARARPRPKPSRSHTFYRVAVATQSERPHRGKRGHTPKGLRSILVARLNVVLWSVVAAQALLESSACRRWVAAFGEPAAGGEVEERLDFTGAADHGPHCEDCTSWRVGRITAAP